jgi:hypothetical protein
VKARRFQQAVRFEQADPVLAAPSQDLDQVFCQVPGVEHQHPEGHLVPDGLFDQFDCQRDFRPKLLMPRPKLGILKQHGIDLLMQVIPRFSLGRDL